MFGIDHAGWKNPVRWRSEPTRRAVIALLTAATCLAVVGEAKAEELQLVLSGSCPGETIVSVVGGWSDQPIDVFIGSAVGTEPLAQGGCIGVVSGLVDPQRLFSASADPWGRFSSTVTLPNESCGAVLQVASEPFCELSQIRHLVSGHPAPVARTGQEFSWQTGDDGAFQRGVPSPDPRFADNQDGTVTDNLTGRVWLKDANCFGLLTWSEAIAKIGTLGPGMCGLSGPEKGTREVAFEPDWRLPNLRELLSLVDYSRSYPPLPAGHPFVSVQSGSSYWSSTTMADSSVYAWLVTMTVGSAELPYFGKDLPLYVWPVRGRD